MHSWNVPKCHRDARKLGGEQMRIIRFEFLSITELSLRVWKVEDIQEMLHDISVKSHIL